MKIICAMKAVFTLIFFLLFALSTAAQTPPEMQFRQIEHRHCEPCVFLYAEGAIVTESTRRFQEALDTLEKTTSWSRVRAKAGEGPRLVILLNSLGGNMDAAYSIGRQLRLYKAYTMVAMPKSSDPSLKSFFWSSCASACGFVLLGGIDRRAVNYSLLGLHQPQKIIDLKRNYSGREVKKILDQTSGIISEMARFIQEMNASPEILIYVYTTNSTALHRMKHDEAIRLELLSGPFAQER